MKTLSFLIVALSFTVSVSAHNAQPKVVSKYAHVTILPNHSASTAQPKKAKRIADYPEIIDSQPEGTLLENWSQYADGWYLSVDAPTQWEADGTLCQLVLGNDNSVYIKDPISNLSVDAWIKGYKAEGDTVVFNLPQKLCIGENSETGEQTDCVAMRMVAKYYTDDKGNNFVTYIPDTKSQVVKYVMHNDTLRMVSEDGMILGLASVADGGWMGFGDKAHKRYKVKDPMYAPQNTDAAQSYILTHTPYEDEYSHIQVRVAIEGNDIFISGLSPYYPDAWVKGTLNGNKVVFKGKQYMGVDEIHNSHDYFMPIKKEHKEMDLGGGLMVPYDSLIYTDEVVFDFDVQSKELSTNGNMIVSGGKEFVNSLYSYYNASMTPWDNKPGVPATPEINTLWPYDEDAGWGAIEFNMSSYDVDGNYLDPANLYYRIYLDDKPYVYTPDKHIDLVEDMTDVPYLFDGNDWLVNGDIRVTYFYRGDFTYIGVQAIYIDKNDNNKRYESPIVWYNNEAPAAVEEINANNAVKSVYFTDLCGRKVTRPQHGIYIRSIKKADGTVETSKVIIK